MKLAKQLVERLKQPVNRLLVTSTSTNNHAPRHYSVSPEHNIRKDYDPSQLSQFDDKCILVDANDQEMGSATKRDCHLLSNINKGMLHRAFSVFLFDSNKRLLLQQRSLQKITYPNHWTNTCCSHPLFVGTEMDETNDYIGIKRAAKRRFINNTIID